MGGFIQVSKTKIVNLGFVTDAHYTPVPDGSVNHESELVMYQSVSDSDGQTSIVLKGREADIAWEAITARADAAKGGE